ncbi:hypothetical protein LSM04_006373 [Trypanosoma melophagium]|uniref:uncharacterized protein n=1 Tax=Trypanosoma melophagium TaxID=715481 RepID=UPI003519E8A4|nr:hypothetical protein LSM04_006373 [Trypanosoma melophagium]
MRQAVSLTLFLLWVLVGVSLDVNALVVHRPAALARREIVTRTVSFGPPLWSGQAYRGELLLVQTEEICPPAGGRVDEKIAEKWHGHVLLVLDTACSRGGMVARAELHGAVGVLVESSMDSSGISSLVNIPVEILTHGDFEVLKDFIRNGFVLEVSLGRNLNILRYAT